MSQGIENYNKTVLLTCFMCNNFTNSVVKKLKLLQKIKVYSTHYYIMT